MEVVKVSLFKKCLLCTKCAKLSKYPKCPWEGLIHIHQSLNSLTITYIE